MAWRQAAIPLLGLIVFPYATLFYVLAYSPVSGGVGGLGMDLCWLRVGSVFDIGHWVGGAVTLKEFRLPTCGVVRQADVPPACTSSSPRRSPPVQNVRVEDGAVVFAELEQDFIRSIHQHLRCRSFISSLTNY